MCESLHVAVKMYINYSFLDLYIYICRNRQSGKTHTRNAENANTKARMHLVPDTNIIIHFVNVFMPQRWMSCTIKTRLRNVFVLHHIEEK